jgi:hypothetical protein
MSRPYIVIMHFNFHGFLNLSNPGTSYKRAETPEPGNPCPFSWKPAYKFPFQVSGNRETSEGTWELFARFADVPGRVFQVFQVVGGEEERENREFIDNLFMSIISVHIYLNASAPSKHKQYWMTSHNI